jgi:hypothetical protein
MSHVRNLIIANIISVSDLSVFLWKTDIFILQDAKALLGNGLETNNETTFAAREQIFNNQVYATIEQLCFLLVCAEDLSMGQVSCQ